jgi:hypothetical protein
MNAEAVNEGYLRASTMLTPLENDHVRFSWLVAVAILVALWMVIETLGPGLKSISTSKPNFLQEFCGGRLNPNSQFPIPNSRLLMVFSWTLILWLSIFLHILAARTGLICFYVIIIITAVRWAVMGPHNRKILPGLVLLLLLPLGAWFLLPSFRNKIKYFKFEMDYSRNAHYLPGGNDATRIISFKAGVDLIKDKPVGGVGFGDIGRDVRNWYSLNYPQMKEKERIIPSSEWLIYGTGAGIAGLIVFTLAMLIPFFARVRLRDHWVLFCIVTALPFLFDIGLEVQFGVFIYSFMVLLSWKWFRVEAVNN